MTREQPNVPTPDLSSGIPQIVSPGGAASLAI